MDKGFGYAQNAFQKDDFNGGLKALRILPAFSLGICKP
jgi:hypothetical protein